eukprot:tig00021128_g18888.t1
MEGARSPFVSRVQELMLTTPRGDPDITFLEESLSRIEHLFSNFVSTAGLKPESSPEASTACSAGGAESPFALLKSVGMDMLTSGARKEEEQKKKMLQGIAVRVSDEMASVELEIFHRWIQLVLQHRSVRDYAGRVAGECRRLRRAHRVLVEASRATLDEMRASVASSQGAAARAVSRLANEARRPPPAAPRPPLLPGA